MTTVHQRFDPPAFMTDFAGIPGQLDAWHEFVSRSFDAVVGAERDVFRKAGARHNEVQYYNAARVATAGPVIEQAITWNAFPKTLLRRLGRARALVEADRVTRFSPARTAQVNAVSYRNLDEYCEWHVVRDPDTQQIRRVTFVSEPFEYWQAMFGDPVDTGGKGTVPFPGDRDLVLRLYRRLVSRKVQCEDLVAHERIDTPYGTIEKGHYNPFNKWNTTHGIVHLSAPPNTLGAEMRLGGDATMVYQNARGEVIVEPEPLICCANFGGADRNSDPTIGATVNALARLGAKITLANPVGLYMDHIDLAGWSAPPGVDVRDCVRIVRGKPRLIERLVVEVPAESGYTVSDLRISGVPVEYGGQIAECITVKLVGAATELGSVKGNVPLACGSRCCVDAANFVSLGNPLATATATPPGKIDAFAREGGPLGGAAARRAPVARPARSALRLRTSLLA